MTYTGKSFSGKAALVAEQKQTRREAVDKMRCSVCEVPILPDTAILWCVYQNCPRTNKRSPTQEEAKKYSIRKYLSYYKGD